MVLSKGGAALYIEHDVQFEALTTVVPLFGPGPGDPFGLAPPTASIEVVILNVSGFLAISMGKTIGPTSTLTEAEGPTTLCPVSDQPVTGSPLPNANPDNSDHAGATTSFAQIITTSAVLPSGSILPLNTAANDSPSLGVGFRPAVAACVICAVFTVF